MTKAALKLALESLKELVADPECDFGPSYELQEDRQKKAITAIREALAQTEPVIDKSAAIRIATSLGWTPQRKPLTDEQIRDLWSWSMTAEAERTANTQQHAFARAIEAAHGIKE